MSNTKYGWGYWVDSAAAVTTTPITIQAIAWLSNQDSGKDIAADDDFELTDGTNPVIQKRAEAASDNLIITFPNGLTLDALTCAAIDGGIAWIYTQ